MKKQSIKYQKEGLFFKTLQKEISLHFKNKVGTKYANKKWYLKAGILLSLYGGCYYTLLSYGQDPMVLLIAFALMGALAILIGLNIGHDAAHHSIAPKDKVNQVFLGVFELLGASSKIWKIRHVYGHHPYPNVAELDEDIAQSRLIRIFPQDPLHWIHRFQHLYIPLLMVLVYTINWMFVRDFLDLRKKRIGSKSMTESKPWSLVKMVAFKVLYLFLVLGLPWHFTGHILWLVLGFLAMHIASGIVITIALVSAHIGTDQQFPVPDDKGFLPYSWAEHQMATTADFCTDNFWFNALFGGFNHHVVHHLFPHINHIHYPELTKILKRMAQQFGVTYHCEQQLSKVFAAHIGLLRREGLEAWRREFDV